MNFGRLELDAKLKSEISAAVDSGTLSHAVLITGAEPKQRGALAVLLAQALMCVSDGEKPCLKCDACRKIKNGAHPDVIYYRAADYKKKSIPVDAVREMRRRAYIVPNEAPLQLFIIPDASELEEIGQNTLLKTLEEPPETAGFILCAESRSALLETVLSRVTELMLSEDAPSERTRSNERADGAALKLLDALTARDEYAMLLASAPLEKDRKTFIAGCERICGELLGSMTGVQSPTHHMLRLESAFELSARLDMHALLCSLISDADKNANMNLLLTRLTSGLAAHMNIQGGKQ